MSDEQPQSDDQALQPRDEGALTRERERSGSVMDAMRHLEEEELAQYCRGISVDGVIAQSVEVELNRGQTFWASKGTLLGYGPEIEWQLKVPGGAGKAVSRALSGEGLSMTHVMAKATGATAILGSNQPGQLVTWDLSQGDIVCTRGTFVAALGDVDIDVTTAGKAGAAFFGGAGVFMQRLSGDGIVILHGSGDFVEKDLDAGESFLVSTGNLAVFSGDVDYDIRRTGGCLKSIFGGEGIFMTEMTGPGWVMLQTLKKLPAQGGGQQGQ
jgi:uncharacterized protein (AIM24 family)